MVGQWGSSCEYVRFLQLRARWVSLFFPSRLPFPSVHPPPWLVLHAVRSAPETPAAQWITLGRSCLTVLWHLYKTPRPFFDACTYTTYYRCRYVDTDPLSDGPI